MSAVLRWDGIEEFRRELRNLPAELADEASSIVLGAAEGAKGEIVSAYERHRVTGNLASHVVVDRMISGEFGAAARVRSTAKHAHIFEEGTESRQTRTGANRGTMPPGGSPEGAIFVPVVIRRRRAMYERLKDLLVRHGATVTGYA